MRVYISGPITGHEDYMLNFKDAETYLTEQGYIVFNPAAVNSQMPTDTTYDEYIFTSISSGISTTYIAKMRMGIKR